MVRAALLDLPSLCQLPVPPDPALLVPQEGRPTEILTLEKLVIRHGERLDRLGFTPGHSLSKILKYTVSDLQGLIPRFLISRALLS